MTNDEIMPCPLCGGIHTHVDRVVVAGRDEDGPFTIISVDRRGDVTRGGEGVFPGGGEGRRHTVALEGRCEECGNQFALTFQQHKGSTYMQSQPRP